MAGGCRTSPSSTSSWSKNKSTQVDATALLACVCLFIDWWCLSNNKKKSCQSVSKLQNWDNSFVTVFALERLTGKVIRWFANSLNSIVLSIRARRYQGSSSNNDPVSDSEGNILLGAHILVIESKILLDCVLESVHVGYGLPPRETLCLDSIFHSCAR